MQGKGCVCALCRELCCSCPSFHHQLPLKSFVDVDAGSKSKIFDRGHALSGKGENEIRNSIAGPTLVKRHMRRLCRKSERLFSDDFFRGPPPSGGRGSTDN